MAEMTRPDTSKKKLRKVEMKILKRKLKYTLTDSRCYSTILEEHRIKVIISWRRKLKRDKNVQWGRLAQIVQQESQGTEIREPKGLCPKV